MVKFGCILACTVLIFAVSLPGCIPQEKSAIIVVDPKDQLIETLQLTDEQLEKLELSAGTLQLTPEQVNLIRDSIEQIFQETEHEEWLGETRWQEIQDIYQSLLARHEVDLQKAANLARDIYDNLQEQSVLEVVTSFGKLSEEGARLAEIQNISLGIPEGSALLYTPRGTEKGDRENLQEQPILEVVTSFGKLSEEGARLAEIQNITLGIPEGSTLLYTPKGADEGDRVFYYKPWTHEWARGWANSIAVANIESGAIAVHSDSGLGLGSAAAYAGQRILIDVHYDNTDVEIEVTIAYISATVNTFIDLAGTYIGRTDLHARDRVYYTIDPLFGWKDGIKKLLGEINKLFGVLFTTIDLEELRGAIELYGDFHEYKALREALRDAEERVISYSAESLPKGTYFFEVGLKARTVSVLLGSSGAVVIGQIPQIKVTQSFDESEPDEKKRGNTVGNINNIGLVAQQGEWLFYANWYTHSPDYIAPTAGIYRTRIDGSGKTRVTGDAALFLNIVDNWIYYRNESDGGRLYKIRSDGSGRTKISDDAVMDISVVGGWIYYRNESDGNKLYKVRTDGSGRVRLNHDFSSSINVVGEWIYYINTAIHGEEMSHRIYKMRTDGTGRVKISDDECLTLNVVEDWIYYINVGHLHFEENTDESECYNLYKIRTDGSGRTRLNNDYTIYINVVGDCIYYDSMVFLDEYDNGRLSQQSLYKIKTDGSSKTKISDDWAHNINVVGDWIYYMNELDDYRLYRIKTDGSNRQRID